MDLLSWQDSLRILLVGFAGMSVGAYADIPSGILGGESGDSSDSAAYAATVSSTGTVSEISGLPAAVSNISGVAINESGLSLIGGQGADGNGYAVFVTSAEGLISLPVSFTGGKILSTAVNASNVGLIGGAIDFNEGSYAAVVLTDGTVSPLTFDIDLNAISGVSLNDSGVGLLAGEGAATEGAGFPYAAYVMDDSTATVANLPTDEPGHLFSAALNSSGDGIIGGWGGADNAAYAAFVTVSGGASSSFTALPSEERSMIYGVAINDSGLGLVGGTDGTNAFAGYVATDGTLTPLFESPFAGTVYSVAMNSSGNGLIGGQNGSDLYAAFVQYGEPVTSIILDSISGMIESVAISDAGVGLIGGQQDSSESYAMLVAPNGTLTPLNVSSTYIINSVALNDAVSSATPQSSGPYSSATYTQLAAISALDSRFIQQNRNWTRARGAELAQADIAHNEANLASNETDLSFGPQMAVRKQTSGASSKQSSVWIAPFGDLVYLKDQGAIPSYSNEIGGALLGYDYLSSSYLVGASLGYAFNYVHYSNGLGHGKVQEEMACFYGTYYTDHFRLSGALWGGLYQFWNVRHSMSSLTSKGQTHGWILDPHIELATPWAIDQRGLYLVEPFCMFDWVNSWQNHFTESGGSGFNLKMGNLYSSLLQSEVGLRFYEQFTYGWGDLNLEEKLSYVNQAPFHIHSVTTAFVGSASTFPIAVGSSKIENLGALQLTGAFVPRNSSYPFGGFSLQTTANASYQAYFVTLFSGIHF